MTETSDDGKGDAAPPSRASQLTIAVEPVLINPPILGLTIALALLGVVAGVLGFGDFITAAGIAKIICVVAVVVAVLSRFPATRLPDDGPLSMTIRALDIYLGRFAQGVLFALLAIVIAVAALAAIHDKLVAEHLGRWWHYIVRGGTFTIAMIGAVFATHHQRHLAMDLVSRRLSPRGRLALGVVLKLFTIVIASLLVRSGLHQREVVGGQDSLNILMLHITDADIVTMMPIGAALIILHTVLHIVVDLDYLVRGKLPPERERTGH